MIHAKLKPVKDYTPRVYKVDIAEFCRLFNLSHETYGKLCRDDEEMAHSVQENRIDHYVDGIMFNNLPVVCVSTNTMFKARRIFDQNINARSNISGVYYKVVRGLAHLVIDGFNSRIAVPCAFTEEKVDFSK